MVHILAFVDRREQFLANGSGLIRDLNTSRSVFPPFSLFRYEVSFSEKLDALLYILGFRS